MTNVADLKGKRIAYPPGSTAHYALMAAVKVNNIAAKEVRWSASLRPTWSPHGSAAISTQVMSGDRSRTRWKATGARRSSPPSVAEERLLRWNDYVVRKEFAEKYPEIVVKFLQTYQQTVEMYNKDREGMVKLVAQHLSQNEAAVRDTMAGLYFPPFKELSTAAGRRRQIAPAMLDTARFLVELGDLKQSEVPPEFKPFMNTSYMERAEVTVRS